MEFPRVDVDGPRPQAVRAAPHPHKDGGSMQQQGETARGRLFTLPPHLPSTRIHTASTAPAVAQDEDDEEDALSHSAWGSQHDAGKSQGRVDDHSSASSCGFADKSSQATMAFTTTIQVGDVGLKRRLEVSDDGELREEPLADVGEPELAALDMPDFEPPMSPTEPTEPKGKVWWAMRHSDSEDEYESSDMWQLSEAMRACSLPSSSSLSSSSCVLSGAWTPDHDQSDGFSATSPPSSAPPSAHQELRSCPIEQDHSDEGSWQSQQDERHTTLTKLWAVEDMARVLAGRVQLRTEVLELGVDGIVETLHDSRLAPFSHPVVAAAVLCHACYAAKEWHKYQQIVDSSAVNRRELQQAQTIVRDKVEALQNHGSASTLVKKICAAVKVESTDEIIRGVRVAKALRLFDGHTAEIVAVVVFVTATSTLEPSTSDKTKDDIWETISAAARSAGWEIGLSWVFNALAALTSCDPTIQLALGQITDGSSISDVPSARACELALWPRFVVTQLSKSRPTKNASLVSSACVPVSRTLWPKNGNGRETSSNQQEDSMCSSPRDVNSGDLEGDEASQSFGPRTALEKLWNMEDFVRFVAQELRPSEGVIECTVDAICETLHDSRLSSFSHLVVAMAVLGDVCSGAGEPLNGADVAYASGLDPRLIIEAQLMIRQIIPVFNPVSSSITMLVRAACVVLKTQSDDRIVRGVRMAKALQLVEGYPTSDVVAVACYAVATSTVSEFKYKKKDKILRKVLAATKSTSAATTMPPTRFYGLLVVIEDNFDRLFSTSGSL